VDFCAAALPEWPFVAYRTPHPLFDWDSHEKLGDSTIQSFIFFFMFFQVSQ